MLLLLLFYIDSKLRFSHKGKHRLRMSGIRVLRQIFDPMWDEVIGGWRKLYSVEIHYSYFSPYDIRVMKSRRVRSEGYVARMEKRKIYAYSFYLSGFGGLEVSLLAFGTQVRGFKLGRSRRIFRAKNPQRAFLRRGSKSVGPTS